MSRRGVGRVSIRPSDNASPDLVLSGVRSDVPRAFSPATSGLTPLVKISQAPDEARQTNAKTQERLKKITGRMSQLLRAFEESYAPPELMEDFRSNVGKQTAQIDNSELLIEDYKDMCLERTELLSSLHKWFDISHIDDMGIGVSSDSMRSFEEGKLTLASAGLKEVKGQIAKIASLGQSVQSLIAEKKKLEEELAKAKLLAANPLATSNPQEMSNKELRETIEKSRRNNTVWKNAASEVCKMLTKVREAGDNEAKKLIEQMQGMVKTLDERSNIIESLRLDLQRKQRDIEQYRGKLTHFEAAQEHFASEIDYWKQQVATTKQELVESQELCTKTQARVEELEEKVTKSTSREVPVRQYSNSNRSESVLYIPSDESYQFEEEESEDKWGDPRDEDQYCELRQKLETSRKEKNELKIKLARREGEIRVLQSEKVALQQSTPVSTDVSSTFGKEIKKCGSKCRARISELEKGLSRARKVLQKTQKQGKPVSAELAKSMTLALAGGVGGYREQEYVDQSVQTDWPELERGKSELERGKSELERGKSELETGKSVGEDGHLQEKMADLGDQTLITDVNVGQPVPSVKSSASQNQTNVAIHPPIIIQADSHPNTSTADESVRDELLSLLLPSGGDMTVLNELDAAKCHSLGVQLADTLKERLESAQGSRQTDKVGEGNQDEWLFEEIYSSSLRDYVRTMVSKISDIIRGFVQKASTLVDSESLKVSAAIHNLRNDLPEDEQHQVYWTTEIDLTQTEAGHNKQPQIPSNPLIQPSDDIDEFVCPVITDPVGGEWWRNVPFSYALSAIGSHCIDALQLTNELFENNVSKQMAEMESVVKVTVKRQEEPKTEVTQKSWLSAPQEERRSASSRRLSSRQKTPDVLNVDVSTGRHSQENDTKIEFFANQQRQSDSLEPLERKGNSEGFPRPYTSGDAEEAARFLQPAVHIETSMSDHAVQEGKDELGSLRFSNRLMVMDDFQKTPRRLLTPQPQKPLPYLTPQPPTNSPLPDRHTFSSWSHRPTSGFEMQAEEKGRHQGQFPRKRPMQSTIPRESLPELLRGRQSISWSQRQSIVARAHHDNYVDDLTGPGSPASGVGFEEIMHGKQTADDRRQRGIVSGIKYLPRHLPHAMVTPQQHHVELHVPHITTVTGRGSIRLGFDSVSPRRPVGTSGRERRRRTHLFSQRRKRRSLLSEDWTGNSLTTAVQSGLTTTDLKNNIESYEPLNAAIHNAHSNVPSFINFVQSCRHAN